METRQLPRLTHLQTITPIRFPINHVHQFLVHLFPCAVPLCPVVAGSSAGLGEVNVFRVVKSFERGREDVVDYLGSVNMENARLVAQEAKALPITARLAAHRWTDGRRAVTKQRRIGTHPRFQVYQYSSRNEMLVVRLVEEYILPVALTAFRCPVFEIPSGRDTMFRTELLPKLHIRISSMSRILYSIAVAAADRSRRRPSY